MAHDPTEIYRAASTQQAHVLAGMLKESGIEAMVYSDVQSIAGGEVPLGWSSLARIVVPRQQAAAARQLVMKFEEQARDGQLQVPDDQDEVADSTAEQWRQWPHCPECGQKRQVLCSICGTAGTDFPLMDILRSGESEQVLLYCRTCDDHFRPQFYRRCHACGHDYGDGIRVDRENRPALEPVPPRVWLVAGGVAALLTALIAYFAWVLR
jgi:hypothetical protein